MFRNKLFTILLFGSLCASVTTAGAEVIFSDSFESGDMSATNPDGFLWGSNNMTSVVTQHEVDGPIAIYNNKQIYSIKTDTMPDGSLREWSAKDGKNSLRFRYAADKEWTEQRFDFGKGYPEIWLSYRVRVPLNYDRGTGNGADTNNNKWLLLLMGKKEISYNDANVTLWANLDRPNAAGTGINMSSSIRKGGRGYISETSPFKDFVMPADAGRWMQVIYHLRANSTEEVDDGIYQMYRKWENEPTFTLVQSIDPAPLPITQASIDSGYNGWGSGYFMGWVNDPYSADTEWLIDDIVFSTTSLLPDPAPKSPGSFEGKVIIK